VTSLCIAISLGDGGLYGLVARQGDTSVNLLLSV
jgi:hypothetical protein